MFSKPKDSAVPQAQSPAAARRSIRTAPSIISADLSVKGDLVASGDVQIDGNVDGNIRSHALTIGDTATINGDVYAEDVTVRGRVKGTIHARRVQLAQTSHVEGDIIHESLAVETGAFFDGHCRHSDNPLAESGTARVATPRREEAPQAKVIAAAPAPANETSPPVAVRTGGLFSGKSDKESSLVSARN